MFFEHLFFIYLIINLLFISDMKTNKNLYGQQLSQQFADWKAKQTSTPIYCEYDEESNIYSVYKDYTAIINAFHNHLADVKIRASIKALRQPIKFISSEDELDAFGTNTFTYNTHSRLLV